MDMTVIIISGIGSASGGLEADRAIVRCLSLPLQSRVRHEPSTGCLFMEAMQDLA